MKTRVTASAKSSRVVTGWEGLLRKCSGEVVEIRKAAEIIKDVGKRNCDGVLFQLVTKGKGEGA